MKADTPSTHHDKKHDDGETHQKHGRHHGSHEKDDGLRDAALKLRKQAFVLFGIGGLMAVAGIGLLLFATVGSSSSSEAQEIETSNEVREASSDVATISSTLGFSVTYNHVLDNARATTALEFRNVEETLPDEGPVEWVERDYENISIRPDYLLVDQEQLAQNDYRSDRSSMYIFASRSPSSVEFSRETAETNGTTVEEELMERFKPKSGSVEGYSDVVTEVSVEELVIGDITYLVGTYRHDIASTSLFDGTVREYSYLTKLFITVQNGLNYNITLDFLERGFSEEAEARYMSYIASMTYSEPDPELLFSLERLDAGQEVAVLGASTDVVSGASVAAGIPLLGGTAFAQEESTDVSDVVALNEPASVRILAGYCATMTLTSLESGGGSAQIPLSCTAGQGSGFILSNDGYIGTNGHVAAFSPNSLIADQVQFGNREVIEALLRALVPTASAADISAGASFAISDQNSRAQLAQFALLGLDVAYEVSNVVETRAYKIQLGHTPSDVSSDLSNVREANDIFIANPAGVVDATFVASDYNSADPYAGGVEEPVYTASDIAVLKINGDTSGFPIVNLGSATTLDNGADIIVIGYPGVIESTAITSSNEIEPTATRGVVSSVRTDSSGDQTIIQTDATIDKGNSGGPGFNANGQVVGIATYGITSQIGGGDFNYLRDVQDLKDVLDAEGITLDTNSEIQNTWASALENYGNRYFSDAIGGFERVLELYPNHPTAQDFINRSEERRANGEEATKLASFVLPLALGFTTVGLGGGGTAVAMHNKHRKQLVASGYAPPQMVQRVQARQQMPQQQMPVQPQPVAQPQPTQPVQQQATQQPVAPQQQPQPPSNDQQQPPQA